MTEDLTTKVSAPAGAVESGGRRRARQPPLLGEDDGPSAHSSSRIGGSCPASKSREADGRTLGFWPETAAHESRSSGSFRDDSSRLKDSVLEQEREVIRGMVRAAHLHAPDAALDVRIVDAFHFRVDDPVADVFFPMPSEVLAVRLHLADQDRRGPEVPHPLAQLKEVLPGILESRHDFDHRQRIEPVDERTDSVPLGHAVVSIGRCGYNRSEAVIRGEQRLRTERKRKKKGGVIAN